MTETEFLDATSVFLSSPVSSGMMFDEQSGSRPTIVSGWDESSLELGAESSHFGFVHCGRTMLSCGSGSFELSSGMYFSVPGAATVKGAGVGFVASCIGLRGLFQMGGPIEEKGRLQYIDGCSDTLLIAPATMGDPRLNLLHIQLKLI